VADAPEHHGSRSAALPGTEKYLEYDNRIKELIWCFPATLARPVADGSERSPEYRPFAENPVPIR
jgi:hypothetical protein